MGGVSSCTVSALFLYTDRYATGTTVFKVREYNSNHAIVASQTVLNPLDEGKVIKLSWQLQERKSEVEFLELLREMRISSVPELVTAEDLEELQDGIHGDIQGILRKPQPRSTDNRVYRAIVMKPYLVPLTRIPDFNVFYEMFKGTVDGECHDTRVPLSFSHSGVIWPVHYQVYVKGGVLHRDINPENLMVRSEKDGGYTPYLIDFDFAVRTSELNKDRILTHRTMATPFLATTLLSKSPPSASYGSDLESFYWSLWWIAVSYGNGKRRRTTLLNEWSNGHFDNIRVRKHGFLVGGVTIAPPSRSMPGAEAPLKRLTNLFYSVLVDGPRRGMIVDLTYETFRYCL